MKLICSFAAIEAYNLNVFILGMSPATFVKIKQDVESWLELRDIRSNSYNNSQWLTFPAELTFLQRAELQEFLQGYNYANT